MKDHHHRLLAVIVSVLTLAAVVLVLQRPHTGPGSHPHTVVPYKAPTPKPDASPVTVTFNSPQGADFNPGGAPTIVATFSQAMVPLGQVSDDVPVKPFTFDPSLPGRYRWIGSHTVTFIPEHLPYGTSYTVTVPAGLVSEEGGTLPQAFTWTFETRRPKVDEVWPGGDAAHVGANNKIFIRFNQPVSPDGIKPFVELNGTDKADHHTTFGMDAEPLTEAELKQLRDDRWSDVQPETVAVVVPSGPLPLATDYVLTLKRGYRGSEGNLGSVADETFNFSTYGPLAFSGLDKDRIDPQTPVTFKFTNSVKMTELIKHVKFDPPVRIPKDIDLYDASELAVDLSLRAMTDYHFTIDGDLTDVYGQKIGGPASGEFHTGHFNQWLSMKEGFWSVEASQPHQVPMGLVNLHSLQVGFKALTPDTIVPLLQVLDRGDSNVPALAAHMWSGVEHDDVVTWKNLNIQPALETHQHGLVWLQVEDPTVGTHDVRMRNAILAVTNLAINLKTSPENTTVWVTTLGQGTPATGVDVQLRDARNRVLWHGKSDKDGLVQAPGWHQLGLRGQRWDAPVLYALATQGEDTVVARSASLETYSFDVPTNLSGTYPNTECFMFTERGLYRAGEDVNFKGIYREIRQGQWTVKSGLPLHLKVANARGDKVAEADVKTDDFGGFSYTLHVPDGAPSGDWSLTAASETPKAEFRNDFQVQAFRPVTFEVKVNTDKDLYKQGETLSAQVSGTYLFGSPVQNGDTTWTMSLAPWSASYADYDGYQFGRDQWLERTTEGLLSAGRSEDSDESQSLFARGQGKLSADGKLPLSFPLKGDKLTPDNKTLTIEANVEAPGHKQVSGRVSVPVFAGDYTIGVKLGTDFLEAGKPETVQVVTLTPDGKSQPGHTIHVRLMRREWDSVRHEPAAAWDTQPHDTEIHSEDCTTTDKPVSVSLTPTQAGFYYIEASGHDNSTHTLTTTTSFWTYGGGYVAWSRGEGDRIPLVADKRHYKPGDTARIMVQNPYEKAWALVTVERELVLSRHVEEVHGSSPVIEIPLDHNDIPNVYVSVVLIQGRRGEKPKYDDEGEDVGQPSFKLGYVDLPVDPAEQQLKVDVTPDHGRYGPGDTVTVDLALRDAKGQPVSGQITLAAVDKGVLNLIGYQTPDAFTDFYGSRALAVGNAETRSYILGSHKTGEKGAPGGGGGADMDGLLNVRKNFKMTAYWNPSILTDANGHATVSFKLPDNLSTFRLMAVAQTRTSQFGSNQSEFVVNKPLVMTGSIPRFATVGDQFSAGVTVTNNTPQRQNVTVKAQANGLELTGTAEKTADVPAQGTAVVLFDYKAPSGGEVPPATLVYSGTLGSDTDALQLSLPIVSPKVLEAVATAGDTDKAARESVTVPVDVWPGTSRLEVGLSSTALSSLRSALDSLVKYPYGCLEQKLSRIYPMLLGEQLAPQFGIADFNQAKVKQYVTAFINEFPTYQKPSGGCTLWGTPTDDEIPFVSAYAYLVLTQARRHGYQVPESSLESLHSYVSGLLTLEESGWRWPYTRADRLGTQCLAVYALALNDDNLDSSINHLWDERADMSLVSQAWLARAMAHSGHFKAQLHELMIKFQQGIQLDPTSGYVEDKNHLDSWWIFESRVRTTAVIMAALLDAGETTHTPEILRWLLKHSQAGEWATTQDNAWALDAALTYLHKMEKETPNFTATVTLDSKPVAHETFSGRSTRVAMTSAPLAAGDQGKTLPLELTPTGQGRLYYTLRLFYSPNDGQAWARDQGLAVDKHLTTLDGKEPGELKAGQVYMATLTVVSPRERTYVAVNDPIPAGFEVVNTDFETESQALAQTLAKAQEKDAREDHTWLGTFNHWETYDDKVLLFADQLQPGAHRFTYLVRAMYPGAYWQGSTRAEAMYEPETFGGTAASHVTVVP